MDMTAQMYTVLPMDCLMCSIVHVTGHNYLSLGVYLISFMQQLGNSVICKSLTIQISEATKIL